jgi:outer membrane protein assembly factor BamB
MAEVREQPLEEVEEVEEKLRVCRVCGSPNPVDDTNYCNNCWVPLAHANLVPQAEAESRFYRRRHRLLKNKPMFYTLVVVLGLILWRAAVAWDVFYMVAPSPEPTNPVTVYDGPGAWGQTGRTPQNTAFIPKSPPVPGKVEWTFSVVPARIKPAAPRVISAPSVAGGRAFLTTDGGRAVALDLATGGVLWEFETGLPSTTSPAVAAGLVIISSRPGHVFALDWDTGEPRWQIDLESNIVAPPIIAGGRAYVGSADNILYALDVTTGRRLWRFNSGSWIVSQVAYNDGSLVVTTTDSVVHVLDAETGRERFKYDTGRGRNLYGSASILGDTAYVASHRGTLFAVKWDLSNVPLERRIWSARVKMAVWWSMFDPPVQKGTVWISHMGGRIIRSPAVGPENVYVSVKDGRVVSLDAVSGELLWESQVGGEITTGPVVAGDTVLVGTKKGHIAGIDTETGAKSWDFKTGNSEITGSPIVSGDMILAVARNGTLYAITAGD